METEAKDLTSIRPQVNPEEEALKRNTDCVYFLASPLTCKKGAECEFRHSDSARVNPRDCWYWLEGRCLNLNCSFRHPPFEGFLASPTTPLGSSHPPDLASTSIYSIPVASATQNPNKQNIPCHYFKKGMCLKGDKCHFVHGPLPTTKPVLLKVPDFTRPVTDKIQTQTVRETSWSLNKCNSQQCIPNHAGEIDQTVAVVSAVKPVKKEEDLLAIGFPVGKNKLPTELDKQILPKSHPRSLRPQSFQTKSILDPIRKDNGMDHLGKVAYAQVGDPLEEARDCNQNVHSHDHYDQKNRRVSFKVSPERGISRRDIPGQIDSSDLRHQLQKHRRLNGSTSAIISDHREEPGYLPRRYQNDQFLHEEVSIGKRLQGRITLPARIITDDSLNVHSGGDVEKARSWDRTSPGRPSIYQRRLSHRLGQRTPADSSADARNHTVYVSKQRIPHVRELHNLKNVTDWKDLKASDKSERRSIKSNYEAPSREHNHKEVDNDSPSFEGPKSLSEILKRKRGTTSGNGDIFSNDEENDQKLSKRNEVSSRTSAFSSNEEFSGKDKLSLGVADQSVVQMNHALRTDKDKLTLDIVEESEIYPVEEEEGLITSDVEEQPKTEFSDKEDVLEIEGEMMVEDMDGPEFDNYEQGDEEYDYEEIEGEEDFKLEENAYEYNREDLNEEGGDFAEKVNVMYS